MGVIWLLGVVAMNDPLAWFGALTLAGGVGGAVWWERTHLSRRERRIIRWWTEACRRCRIWNVPVIRLKTPGRLDARWSAASLTLQVEVNRPAPPDRTKPAKPTSDWGVLRTIERAANQLTAVATDLPDLDSKTWVTLKSLEQLAGMHGELKMVMGHDIAEVRIKPNRGNHATVVIVFHIEGARRVVIGVGAGGVGIEIAVLADRPNKAWVYHAALGGYVLAQHRHATEYEPRQGDGWNNTVELDDDEAAAWWVNDLDDEPQSGAPLGPPQPDGTDSDHENGGCYDKEGRGEETTPPWPAPNGPPYRVEAA